MRSDDLPPVLLNSNKRYMTSIPEGKISQHSPSEVPIVSRRGGSGKTPISMRDIIADSSLIDLKLKSLSHGREDSRLSLENEKREKANMKFLKYKFNPNAKEGDV